MSALTPFDFKGHPVRVLHDELGEPWFVAKDVTDVLGFGRAHDAIKYVPDNHKGGIKCPTPGGTQTMLCVDEPGLYRLVLRSNKPEAEPFMEWVTSEVLPAIRRHGYYAAPGAEHPADFPDQGQAARIVDHGRVVAAVSRMLLTLERVPARRVGLVNTVAARITGIDTVALLQEAGWTPPDPDDLDPEGSRRALGGNQPEGEGLDLAEAILDAVVPVTEGRTRCDMTIAELVHIAARRAPHPAVGAATAAAELGRHGLRVTPTHLLVSNTHRGIKRLLRDTPHAAGWSRTLRRLPGARPVDPLYYGGSKSRGTAVPLGAIASSGSQA